MLTLYMELITCDLLYLYNEMGASPSRSETDKGDEKVFQNETPISVSLYSHFQ